MQGAVFLLAVSLSLSSLLVAPPALCGIPRIWTVKSGGSADFRTIQEAIDAANSGDTVFVRSGVYYEALIINKTVNLLGENHDITVVNASQSNPSSSAISVYEEAAGTSIVNFTLTGSKSGWGITIGLLSNIWIQDNVITGNSGGIVASSANATTFVNNTVSSNLNEGLLLVNSSNDTMRNNTISRNRFNLGILGGTFSHKIDDSNLVNGKPVYYIMGKNNWPINPSYFPNVGYLALINCTNMVVEGLTLKDNYNGLLLAGTHNSTIRDNFIVNNSRGLDLSTSSGNTINSNKLFNNCWQGVSLACSPRNTFEANNLTSNQFSLEVSGNAKEDFVQNISTTNTVNMQQVRYIMDKKNERVSPSAFNNTGYLALVNCSNMTVSNFTFLHSNILIAFSNTILVNENTIQYGKIEASHSQQLDLSHNRVLSADFGVSMAHSNNSRIMLNSILNCSGVGVMLTTSSKNMVSQNVLHNDSTGLELQEFSNNNTIQVNNITGNRYYGLAVFQSSDNLISHNNFVNPVPWQAVSSMHNINRWNDDYPSGGNYWSDYKGSDACRGDAQDISGSDGIGDTFKTIPTYLEADRYPLMGVFHEYSVPIGQNKMEKIEIITNSSVNDAGLAVWLSSPTEYIHTGDKLVIIHVTGSEGSLGFCRITIPEAVLNSSILRVIIDDSQVPYHEISDPNSALRYLYFTYHQSQHTIMIIPEFPTTMLPLALATGTLLLLLCWREKSKSRRSAIRCALQQQVRQPR